MAHKIPQMKNSMEANSGHGNEKTLTTHQIQENMIQLKQSMNIFLENIMGMVSNISGKEQTRKDKFDMDSDPLLKKEQPSKLVQYQQSSNKQIKIIIESEFESHKSKFGQEYKNRLDSRDIILSHPFHFQLISSIENIQSENYDFLQSQQFKDLCDFLRDFLTDVAQNIISISFNNLLEKKLKTGEAKDFAAKNILLNVQAIFRETIKALEKSKLVKEKDLEDVRYVLVQFIDGSLTQTFKNLAPYYPQAPPTGATARMRQALLQTDRGFNQELDFLFTQSVILEKTSDSNYISFIMTVINKIIDSTSQYEAKDRSKQTMFEKFQCFCENLFYLSQNSAIETSIDHQTDENSQTKENVYSNNNLSGSFKKKDNSLPEISKWLRKITQIKQTDKSQQNQSSFIDQLINNSPRSTTINHMKEKEEFCLGQKIPPTVKKFDQSEIKEELFSAKHSSILRILTKWADNLQSIIDNPEIYTIYRNEPFKTNKNTIKHLSKQEKTQIYEKLKKFKQKKQTLKQKLISSNIIFQGEFFSLENKESIGKYIKRFTETRVLSSKMNSLIIHLIVQYVSSLIDFIVTAGIMSEGQNEFINLVTFNIGDMMRSKIHCDESSFIRLLKILYALDEDESNKTSPFFKLVKIKNKLDQKDNNILIIFLFKGKLQCQLQMSIQKMEEKEQKYYNFSHFIYELTRGKFGLLSECATVIFQNDPILSAQKTENYVEDAKQIKVSRRPSQKETQTIVTDPTVMLKMSSPFMQNQIQFFKEAFICKCCKKLIKNEVIVFMEKVNNNRCNNCILADESFKPLIQLLEPSRLGHNFLKDVSQKKLIQPISSYQKLKTRTKPSLFLKLNFATNKIEFYFVLFEIERTFLVQFQPEEVGKLANSQKLFSYENVSLLVEKEAKMPPYCYLAQQCKIEIVVSSYLMYCSDTWDPVLINMKLLQSLFKKQLISDIYRDILINKRRSLVLTQQMANAENLKEIYPQSKNQCPLEIQEQLSYVQFMSAEAAQLSIIPSWIAQHKNTKSIDLRMNQIIQVTPLLAFKKLETVILSWNNISALDLSSFSTLRFLDLSNNNFQQFSSSSLPRSVKILDLSSNSLHKISLIQGEIQKLNLAHNSLSQFQLLNLYQLIDLNLEQNLFTAIELKNFPKLKYVNLKNNKITRIDLENLYDFSFYNLHQCPQLTSLRCFNLLKLVFILAVKELEELSIRRCGQITSIQCTSCKFKLFQIEEAYNLESISFTSCVLQNFYVNNCQLNAISLLDSTAKVNMNLSNCAQLSNLEVKSLEKVVILLACTSFIHSISMYHQREMVLLTNNMLKVLMMSIHASEIDELAIPTIEAIYILKISDTKNVSKLLQSEIFKQTKYLHLEANKDEFIAVENLPMLEVLNVRNDEQLQRVALHNLPNLKLILISPSISHKLVMDQSIAELHPQLADEGLFGSHSYTKLYKNLFQNEINAHKQLMLEKQIMREASHSVITWPGFENSTQTDAPIQNIIRRQPAQ